MNNDANELSDSQFKDAISNRVRRRLIEGRVESGEDVSALRRFVHMTPVEFAERHDSCVRLAWTRYLVCRSAGRLGATRTSSEAFDAMPFRSFEPSCALWRSKHCEI